MASLNNYKTAINFLRSFRIINSYSNINIFFSIVIGLFLRNNVFALKKTKNKILHDAGEKVVYCQAQRFKY